MPTAPLLDFEKLDLSRTVATQADILGKIKQRGRFALLDGVLHMGIEPALIVGFKEIRGEDWWAADHIPGRPIFPGALMVEAAAQLASYDFMCRTKAPPETFVGFGGLESVRFRGMVVPGQRLIFACTPLRVRPKIFTYQMQAFVERGLVFEGEVIGLIL